jgi:hypothetical protein
MEPNLLEDTYEALLSLGAVKTKRHFCHYWLGRGDSYMRSLRFTSLEPSIDVISVLRSRLLYYAECYERQSNSSTYSISDGYRRLAEECSRFIEHHSERIWKQRVLEEA